MRVISDGAPNVPTSRAEKSVTWWKSVLRRSRPKPIATRAPKYTAATAKLIWMSEKPSITSAHAADVADVAGDDAVVDDAGVERGAA